jgi:hypothetical protein
MYRVITVALLMVLVACGQADKTPEGILPPDAMRDVLLDMNKADVYSSISGENGEVITPDSVRKDRVQLYYRQILDQRKVSVEQFRNSYAFYESHPDRFKKVYDMMLEIVTKERDALDLQARKNEYANDIRSLLPFGKKALISGGSGNDTIIPFVKRKPVR